MTKPTKINMLIWEYFETEIVRAEDFLSGLPSELKLNDEEE